VCFRILKIGIVSDEGINKGHTVPTLEEVSFMEVTKAFLIQKLLIERVEVKQLARELGVHRNTLQKWMKEYEIYLLDWWKYKPIICGNCRHEIDPDKVLPENKRKMLLKKEVVYCEDCKDEVRKAKNREKQQRHRDGNRDYYNYYMRKYYHDKKALEELKTKETTGDKE
jgi:transposase-like protein